MALHERAAELRQQIPTTVAELGGALGKSSRYPADSRGEDRKEILAMAHEALMLARALEAAALSAIAILDPPRPEIHKHSHHTLEPPERRKPYVMG